METKKWSFNYSPFEAYSLGEDLHTPWGGHKRFAYDLIKTFKPAAIVELGTAGGTSFFSFAQSVKDVGLVDTKMFAIDTWKGDKHTRLYNEDVYLFFKNKLKKDFSNYNIELIRDTFDNALNHFESNSIDLLHIDGLHTYDAVKHDFFSWLPKVKPDGIILMHDIYEFKEDFGVHTLWAELKKSYSTLEFEHSSGLGIVCLDKNKFDVLQAEFNKIKLYYLGLNYQEIKARLYDAEKLMRELSEIKATKLFRLKECVKKIIKR